MIEIELEEDCISCDGHGKIDDSPCGFCINGLKPSITGQVLLAFIQKYSKIKFNEAGEFAALLGRREGEN